MKRLSFATRVYSHSFRCASRLNQSHNTSSSPMVVGGGTSMSGYLPKRICDSREHLLVCEGGDKGVLLPSSSDWHDDRCLATWRMHHLIAKQLITRAAQT